jgi:hypothetical protein
MFPQAETKEANMFHVRPLAAAWRRIVDFNS